mmetsp:Transcript_47546/g.101019  ORF Transcript_47546/g.101019 Transcript_47546/m.101019 type:complete len:137 (-) Transcript_47546:187-597(-)
MARHKSGFFLPSRHFPHIFHLLLPLPASHCYSIQSHSPVAKSQFIFATISTQRFHVRDFNIKGQVEQDREMGQMRSGEGEEGEEEVVEFKSLMGRWLSVVQIWSSKSCDVSIVSRPTFESANGTKLIRCVSMRSIE